MELSSQGYSEREIAERLQPLAVTLFTGIWYTLNDRPQENLQHHIHEVIPFEYHKAMIGMKHNLKQTLEIAENSSDPRVNTFYKGDNKDRYNSK